MDESIVALSSFWVSDYTRALLTQFTTVMISTKILVFVNRFAAVGKTRVCA